MSSISFEIGKALEKIKLGNSLLLFGGLIILTSIIVNHNIGLKLGIVIFLGGGVFRLANIILNEKVIKNNILRFILWIILLGIIIYFINKLIPIFY